MISEKVATTFADVVNLDEGREVDDTRIGLQLNLPIYEGGRVSSQTQEAAYRYQQSKDLYEQQRRATERETRSSYLNVLLGIARCELPESLKC